MISKSNLKSANFKGLMIAQFFGAFVDNAFKIIVSLLAMQILLNPGSHAEFVSLIAALFIIPFFIVSPYAGYLADCFSKRNIIIATKLLELVIMLLGTTALLSGNLFFLSFVVLLTAIQSALFGPAKYGILPEILEERELSQGNGYMQMWTFLAIIFGTACGGQMMEWLGGAMGYAGMVLILCSLIGLSGAVMIRKGAPVQSRRDFELNFAKEAWRNFKEIRRKKPLFLVLLAVAYFWFFGAVVQMNTLLYGHNLLNASEGNISLLLVAASLGIGLGSALAGKFSEGRIEFGIVPVGAIGMSIFSFIFGVSFVQFPLAILRLFFLGFFAGFYIVPLNAYFQKRSPSKKRGKYLAVLNMVNALAILLASGFVWLIGTFFQSNPKTIFLLLSFLSLGVTAYVFKALPDALLRFFNWVLTHSIYRIQIDNPEKIPAKGGALLVCNHTSFADPSLILASTTRHVRFLVLRDIYENPVLNPLCKIMNCIPISMDDPPKEIVRSLQRAREAVVKGHILCIFAEGGLTRTGNMLPFARGFEYVMKGLKAPIIPMNIDCIWGSIFSFENNKFFLKVPKQAAYPVRVTFGAQMPADSRPYQVRLAIQELWAEAFKKRGRHQQKLHMAFVREAKKHPFKFSMADSTGLELNYVKVLGMVLMLAQRLFPKEKDERREGEMVGILMPSSVAGSLANGAVLMAGKIPVNLNFTASQESQESAIRQCGIQVVITSRKFLSKLKIEPQKNMVFVEDVFKELSKKEKMIWVMRALLLPTFLLKKFYVRGNLTDVEEVATVIFSSGSTGEPKGVMLTHNNIFSNIEGFYQVGQVQRNDIVMGVLPFFHSFGFTACLCFPVGTGLGVVYHSNPLDAATVGELVQKYKATMILGTPTFFSAYIRKCTKEQFKTVRYACAGAEKFKEQMVRAFIDKFGICPYEGYGATELSPIVAMGVPDFVNNQKTIHQVGNKMGKVGQPIPGVAAKVVKPETFETLPYDQEGLLLIKGPNVMKGYLNQPEKTEKAIRDGWYITGDIASIDREGFICITDRLSRFSKIGGEMVPHVKVEEDILEALGTNEPVCAVTSLPDERKGEKLVVLYAGQLDVEEVLKKLAQKGIPNLWIPKRDDFFQVEAIPLLGSGKMDLSKIKALAKQIAQMRDEGLNKK